MSTIQSTEDLFASLGLSRQFEEQKQQELGMETFLKLMVTQLNNQDPMKPMESGDFLGQIAQFGTVTGIDKLNKSVDELAGSLTSDQALQASSLLGREVLAPGELGMLLPGELVRGEVDLDASASDVALRVQDLSGQLVRELRLGSQPPGELAFSWDGITDAGEHAPPGLYRLSIEAVTAGGSFALEPRLYSKVESVSLGAPGQGLTLNLAGQGSVPLSDVEEIH